MKRIKTVNGWVIYLVQTQRAANKYNSQIGNYVRFSKSGVGRNFKDADEANKFYNSIRYYFHMQTVTDKEEKIYTEQQLFSMFN